MTEAPPALLFRHLARTSRAFYLSLSLLPRALRVPVGLAYALARTADTAADLALGPAALRRGRLEEFRALLDAPDQAAARSWAARVAATLPADPGASRERELVLFLPGALEIFESLAPCDRARVATVLATIVRGMHLDLEWFGDGVVRGVVETRADLDRYTYHVAGCVGEFWTAMARAKLPSFARGSPEALVAAGVRFGKGLQLTNILRDVAKDAENARVYLPRELLAHEGLAARDLANPASRARARPVIRALLAEAIAHYRAGIAYTLAVRPQAWMLRLATALPLAIGIETLGLVRDRPDLLDPRATVKIPRRRVYRLVAELAWRCLSDRALETFFRRSLARSGFREAADLPFELVD